MQDGSRAGYPATMNSPIKKAARGDYAEIIRQCRNLVHPTRYLDDLGNMRTTRKRLDFLLEVYGYLGEHLAGVALRPSELEDPERATPHSS